MKMRKLAVGAGVAVLSLAGAAQAQDACFGLSAADCAVIEEATANTLATVTSFNQTWSIEFSVVGMPESAPLTFDATGSGPVVLDLASALPLSFDQTINASFDDGVAPGGGDTQAILADGVLFLDFGGGDFRSVNVLEALEQGELGGQALPVNPEDLAGADPTAVLGALEGLGDLTAIEGFLNYERSGADFTFTMDVTRLIGDLNFQTTLATLAQEAGPEGQQVAGLLALLPMIITQGDITVVQTIDEAANLVTGLTFNVDATIDGAMLGGTTEPITLTLRFRADLTDVNDTFDIQAPADATPLEMGM